MDTRDDGEPLRPVVTAIHIAPASRLPMRRVETIRAEAGKGLVGDRYHGTRHRHVTVQSQAALDEAAAELGAPVDPAGTRRNVTISGGDVPDAPGTRIRIGDVQLEVVRRAAPCKLLDDTIGPGANAALEATSRFGLPRPHVGLDLRRRPRRCRCPGRAGTRRLNRGSAAGEGRQHPGSGQAASGSPDCGRGAVRPGGAPHRSARPDRQDRSTRADRQDGSARGDRQDRPGGTDRAQRRDGRGRAEGQDRAGRHGRQGGPQRAPRQHRPPRAARQHGAIHQGNGSPARTVASETPVTVRPPRRRPCARSGSFRRTRWSDPPT